jgi:hypothetical protein
MYEKPSKLRASLFGGLILGVLSGLPGLSLINCCCCAGILFGGAMSVYLYRQEFSEEMPPLESSDALVLGIMSGIVGALVATFLTAIVSHFFGPLQTELVRGFVEKIGQKLEDSGSLPPGSMEDMSDKLEQAIKEGGSISGILSSLIYALILYPIFSMIGGLIGFGIFGKKKTTVPPMPPMHP